MQLEDGEIDVRLNSFKGCLSQDKSNKHAEKLPGESNPDLGIGWDYSNLLSSESSPCVRDSVVWIIVFTLYDWSKLFWEYVKCGVSQYM